MNEAEIRFAAYMDACGHTYGFEPDYQVALGLPAPVATKPDFLIERSGVRAVCEVRQFETTRVRDALERAGGYMSTDGKELLVGIRSALFEKAKQLEPFGGLGLPLIVVLSNPLGADVVLDAHHVPAAMFGNLSVRIPIDPALGGAPAGIQPHLALEDYGVFRSPVRVAGQSVGRTNRHPHLSGVLIVHERRHSDDWRREVVAQHPPAEDSMAAMTDATLDAMKAVSEAVAAGHEPSGAYQWADFYELDGDTATPVPADWFRGTRDRRFGFHAAGEYGQLTSPQSPSDREGSGTERQPTSEQSGDMSVPEQTAFRDNSSPEPG